MKGFLFKAPLCIFFIAITFSLLSCSWSVSVYNQAAAIPIGSILVLNQNLQIPPGKTGIYIQGGQVMERTSVSEYLPNCRFEVNTLDNESVTVVTKDKFVVYKVAYESELVSSNPKMYAALGRIVYGVSATAEIRTTEFYIKSDNQPDVLRLRCGHWEDPADAFYLNLDEVKQSLGDVITIEPPKN